MRRVVSFVAAAILATGALVVLAAPATAGDCGPGEVPSPVPGGGTICIPAGGGGGGGDDGGGGGGGGGGPRECTYRGDKIACNDPVRGVWDQGRQCYLLLMKPQPPAGNSLWQELGGDPAKGRIFTCGQPGVDASPTLVYITGGGIPDPEDLARRALDQMQLAKPDIHLAPKPPERTYVGLDTWLWMPAGQWATLRKSVTAGATTVTVTAVPRTAVWDMGPANKTCTSAGREWKFGKMPKGSTTSCSYKYTKVSDFQPDKQFRVTSTISYQVDWTCAGACLGNNGTLGRVNGLPGVAAIVVGERQSVVVGGDD